MDSCPRKVPRKTTRAQARAQQGLQPRAIGERRQRWANNTLGRRHPTYRITHRPRIRLNMTCLARRAQPTQAHKTRRTQALGAFHAERWQELPSPPAPREPRTTFADRNSSPQRRQGSPLGVAPKPENGPDQIPKGPRPNSRRAPTKFQKRARPKSMVTKTKFPRASNQI